MLGLLLNLFFVWFCWEAAKDHFDQGNDVLAWLGIFVSALNAAYLASVIF